MLKNIFFYFLSLIHIQVAVGTNEPVCSKYICRNKTAASNTHYGIFAGEILESSYLNVNISDMILNTTANNVKACVKKCMRTNGCFSANAKFNDTQIKDQSESLDTSTECHLLKENMYSNLSLAVSDERWIHISVKNDGCNQKPCFNGGTCVPNYEDNTSTCNCALGYYGNDCKKDNFYIFGGSSDFSRNQLQYCYFPFEKAGISYDSCYENTCSVDGDGDDASKVGFCSLDKQLPDWEYNFEEDNFKNEGKIKDSVTISKGSGGTIKYSTARKGKILMCDGLSSCVSDFSYSMVFNTEQTKCFKNPHSCINGLTISLWINIAAGEKKRLNGQKSVIFYRGDKSKTDPVGFKFYASPSEDYWHIGYAFAHGSLGLNISDYNMENQWHHFVVVMKFIGDLYTRVTLNGKTYIVNQKNFIYRSNQQLSETVKMFPTDVANVPGKFMIDNFKVWFLALSDDEVQKLHKKEKTPLYQ